jgi:hypothetical protein
MISLSLPLRVVEALDLLLVTRPVTSPRASRLRFPAPGSSLPSAPAFALEAAVAAVARLFPLVAPLFVAAAVAAGLARVAIRDGLALAFSLSLAAVRRVVLVTRLVCQIVSSYTAR